MMRLNIFPAVCIMKPSPSIQQYYSSSSLLNLPIEGQSTVERQHGFEESIMGIKQNQSYLVMDNIIPFFGIQKLSMSLH